MSFTTFKPSKQNKNVHFRSPPTETVFRLPECYTIPEETDFPEEDQDTPTSISESFSFPTPDEENQFLKQKKRLSTLQSEVKASLAQEEEFDTIDGNGNSLDEDDFGIPTPSSTLEDTSIPRDPRAITDLKSFGPKPPIKTKPQKSSIKPKYAKLNGEKINKKHATNKKKLLSLNLPDTKNQENYLKVDTSAIEITVTAATPVDLNETELREEPIYHESSVKEEKSDLPSESMNFNESPKTVNSEEYKTKSIKLGNEAINHDFEDAQPNSKENYIIHTESSIQMESMETSKKKATTSNNSEYDSKCKWNDSIINSYKEGNNLDPTEKRQLSSDILKLAEPQPLLLKTEIDNQTVKPNARDDSSYLDIKDKSDSSSPNNVLCRSEEHFEHEEQRDKGDIVENRSNSPKMSYVQRVIKRMQSADLTLPIGENEVRTKPLQKNNDKLKSTLVSTFSNVNEQSNSNSPLKGGVDEKLDISINRKEQHFDNSTKRHELKTNTKSVNTSQKSNFVPEQFDTVKHTTPSVTKKEEVEIKESSTDVDDSVKIEKRDKFYKLNQHHKNQENFVEYEKSHLNKYDTEVIASDPDTLSYSSLTDNQNLKLTSVEEKIKPTIKNGNTKSFENTVRKKQTEKDNASQLHSDDTINNDEKKSLGKPVVYDDEFSVDRSETLPDLASIIPDIYQLSSQGNTTLNNGMGRVKVTPSSDCYVTPMLELISLPALCKSRSENDIMAIEEHEANPTNACDLGEYKTRICQPESSSSVHPIPAPRSSLTRKVKKERHSHGYIKEYKTLPRNFSKTRNREEPKLQSKEVTNKPRDRNVQTSSKAVQTTTFPLFRDNLCEDNTSGTLKRRKKRPAPQPPGQSSQDHLTSLSTIKDNCKSSARNAKTKAPQPPRKIPPPRPPLPESFKGKLISN